MNLVLECLGWAGSLIVVTVYALNSYQKIKSDSFAFYLFNVSGGILLIIYSLYKSAYANIFINAVWVLIAVPPLIKLMMNIRKRNSK